MPLVQLAGSRGACLRDGKVIGDKAGSHVSFPASMPCWPAPGQHVAPRFANVGKTLRKPIREGRLVSAFGSCHRMADDAA